MKTHPPSTVLFELRSPDGNVWKVYLDGQTEGFPEGTVVINHAKPYVDAIFSANQLQQLTQKDSVALTYQALQEAQIKLQSGRVEQQPYQGSQP